LCFFEIFVFSLMHRSSFLFTLKNTNEQERV
jgi:hypothetical protein